MRKPNFPASLLENWTLKMAWRESRSSWKRLLFFLSSIVLGVAALVAINSFSQSMEKAINEQSKALLGADLAIDSRQALSQEAEALLDSLGGQQSREVRFSSMVYFPKSRGTRLVQVRALDGDFPFYGVLSTSPPGAAVGFREGPLALVDERLMLQFEAEVGETLKVGATTFEIAGKLQSIPGEALVFSFVSPRIFIPKSFLYQTRLIRVGSRVTYRTYFKFSPGTDVGELIANIQPDLERLRLRSTTAEDRRASLGRSTMNLSRFLSLAAFIALLLGGIGVAATVHLHVKRKLATVATLRCLGATSRQTFHIYVVQTLAMGLIGSTLGALLGLSIQYVLPVVLADLLPLKIPIIVSWSAVFQGVVIGTMTGLVFALLSLSSVRKVSPLTVLRVSYEREGPRPRDPLRWFLFALLLAAIVVFAVIQTERWSHALAFVGPLVAVFLLLAAVAKLITVLVKRYFPHSWSYVWRQGLANLHRPNNQTVVLMLALGLGVFLISTLLLIQSSLQQQVVLAAGQDKPNMVLFDIQTDQKKEVIEILHSFRFPVMQEVPIVTMRLSSVKGRPVEDMGNDSESRIPDWALLREYRSTYREDLIDSEELVEGSWQSRSDPLSNPVAISLEEGIAKSLRVSLGNRMVFDVQGVPVETSVESIRRVDWRRFQTNFFVVFPAGILEEAPQFHVVLTRVDSPKRSAELQRAILQRFPNISAVDVTLILDTVDQVLSKIAFAIRFMALFSILTALVVLVGMLVSNRYQRARESVLLRTLGASRRQINQIMSIEYLFLGTFAALTGVTAAIVSSFGLTHFVFEADLVLNWLPLFLVSLTVIILTLVVGMFNSRGLCNRPPLEVLRAL